MAFQPYLNFGGTCREAFTRYQEVFGGDLDIMTFGDMPPGEDEMPAEMNDLVMHAALMVGDDLLMGSDDPNPEFGKVQGMAVSFSTPSVDEAKRIFQALSEGGTIDMPIEETFWAPVFGACSDKFGTPWLIGADAPEAT